MSDAFSLGIQSSMANRRSRDAEAVTYAQIYSNLLISNAQMEESRFRAQLQLKSTLATLDAGLKQEEIQQRGLNKRAQVAAQQSYTDKLLDIYKTEMDNRMKLESALIQEKFKGEYDLQKQQLVNEGNLATTILKNREAVTTATINGKTQVFTRMLENEYGPDVAKIVMDNYDGSLGATMGIFSAIGKSPKTLREEAKFDLEREKAHVLYAQPLYGQDGKPIPGTGGLEFQKLQATNNANYTTALGVTSENVKRFQELRDGLQARMFKVATENGGSEQNEAQIMTALESLTNQLASNPSPEQREKYQQQVAMLMSRSAIPPHLWNNFVGVQSALSYNLMRSADVLGVGMSSMPTEEMIAFHKQMPEDVRSPVEKMSGWLYETIIPGGVRAVAEKGFNSLANVGVGINYDLTSELVNAAKKSGQKVDISKINSLSPSEKLTLLQQMDPTNPTIQDMVNAHKSLPSIVGETLVGDLAEGNPLYKEGHYGLVGDALIYGLGLKILGPVAGGVWRTVAPVVRRTPIAGKVLERIELATLRNTKAVADDWGPQIAKDMGLDKIRPGRLGDDSIPFPKNIDPTGVYSQTFFGKGRLNEMGRARLEQLRLKRAGKGGQQPEFVGQLRPEDFNPAAPGANLFSPRVGVNPENVVRQFGKQEIGGPAPGTSWTDIVFTPGKRGTKGSATGRATITPDDVYNPTSRQGILDRRFQEAMNQAALENQVTGNNIRLFNLLQGMPRVQPSRPLALPGRVPDLSNPTFIPEPIPMPGATLNPAQAAFNQQAQYLPTSPVDVNMRNLFNLLRGMPRIDAGGYRVGVPQVNPYQLPNPGFFDDFIR